MYFATCSATYAIRKACSSAPHAVGYSGACFTVAYGDNHYCVFCCCRSLAAFYLDKAIYPLIIVVSVAAIQFNYFAGLNSASRRDLVTNAVGWFYGCRHWVVAHKKTFLFSIPRNNTQLKSKTVFPPPQPHKSLKRRSNINDSCSSRKATAVFSGSRIAPVSTPLTRLY